MNLVLAQLNYIIGDVEGNCALIIKSIEEAKQKGADLIVFAELALCGYPPQDLLTYASFLDRCEKALEQIKVASKGIAVVLGAPSRTLSRGKKKLYNSAFYFHDTQLKGVQHKSLLPDYDIFDEYRYFEPATQSQVFTLGNRRFAIMICEDSWETDTPGLYGNYPSDRLEGEKLDFIVNIAASPFNHRQAALREESVCFQAIKHRCTFIYLNQVGAQCSLLFDGGSLIADSEGKILVRLPQFESVTYQWNGANSVYEVSGQKYASLYKALIMGVRDFFVKQGFHKAVLGLSGGVDSALTATLAADALGAENITGILLPSKYSSDHSIADALDLAQRLGIKTSTLPIEEINESVLSTLSPLFTGLTADLTEENIQARIRGLLLMAYSNKKGAILLNTTNKSEAAVGYGTLYGDLCGSLAVLADVYKTEVYELCHYINKEKERIPNNTLTKAPSAELRPDQKDSDSLPDYSLLDTILFRYIEEQKSEEKITQEGFEPAVVKKVINLVNKNEYKRFQSAPCLRVSTKAFGLGRVMPLVGKI